MRLPIVPLGTYMAASLPVRVAASPSSWPTVGSPSRESSPRRAARMASSISAVGWVTVSLRRSIMAHLIPSSHHPEFVAAKQAVDQRHRQYGEDDQHGRRG